MKSKLRMIRTTIRGLAVAAAAALSFGACGLNDEELPELSGPSTTGIQIRLEALPDVITADGLGASQIRITVYDQNGTPASGRTVILALANSAGDFADIGTLYSPTGSLLRAGEATVVTDGNGRATAIYTAPPRTDFTFDGSIRYGLGRSVPTPTGTSTISCDSSSSRRSHGSSPERLSAASWSRRRWAS